MAKYLLLKATLLTEGVQTEPDALRDVGTLYKEQNHGLFGWDFENHVELKTPDDFFLEDGTVVQFRLNRKSPYVIRVQGDHLALVLNGQELSTVRWIKRPAYYDKKTSKGNEMIRIGQVGGADNLFFCYQNYCSHFAKNQQCAFCNLVSTSKVYGSVLRKKDFQEIGEVAQAAWAEGSVRHVNITGGCFNHEAEIRVITDLLTAIREHTGFDRVPGVLLPSPAKGDAIRSYYDAGITALGYSLEIWNDAYYQAICPGKAATTTHAEFVRLLGDAVKVFGAGNVYAMLVMGLEPRETFLEGVRTITSLGANVQPYVWAANPGSKLSGHRAPFPEWYEDTILEAAQIVVDSKVPSGEFNNCARCDGNALLVDAVKVIQSKPKESNA
jgi:hypothetical protein